MYEMIVLSTGKRVNLDSGTRVTPRLTVVSRCNHRIGWQFYQYESIKFEDYERHRKRRSKAEMVMSAEDRQWLLRKEWDVSQKEIATAVRQVIKVKNQRRQTIMNDSDALILRWRKTMEALEGCLTPITNAWKKEDPLMYQHDYMSVASDCSQKETLDRTRHKGATIVIDDQVEDEDQVGTVDTSLESGDLCRVNHDLKLQQIEVPANAARAF
jgi:hypothetical protein